MKKLPNKIKKAQGTLRKSRVKENYLDLESIKDIPHPPKDFNLTDGAVKIWFFQIKELINIGIIHNLDLIEFSVYCSEMDRYFTNKKVIDEFGEVFTTSTGYPQIRPELSIMRASFKIAHSLANKFGFNPVARDDIKAQPRKKENKLDELLNA